MLASGRRRQKPKKQENRPRKKNKETFYIALTR
jgi:hypothetical protein